MVTVAITYRPAKDRHEAYRQTHDAIKARFYAAETPKLQAMTKAQLMATGDVSIHETYSKAELIENALMHRWAASDVAKEYQRVMHLENRESEIVDSVEAIQVRLREALDGVAILAKKGTDLASLDGAMNLVKQITAMSFLWLRVAELTGPDRREPLAAIRFVAEEATARAMDALEDNTTELFEHRVAARWIARHDYLIKALEFYKSETDC